ncbi:hypothetical protein [Paenibacillus luteus]|uniref:hypothetical protein n=1 Tax=Paenibacillus luteus TaxID=2545753 RepID=UPI0011412E25|nr:hypothetical protein [Paenibacillus luteus]
MTQAVFAKSKQPIEDLPMQTFALLYEMNRVSEQLSSGVSSHVDVANGVCLSSVYVIDQTNKNLAADNLDVQVYAAMKKA